MKNTDHQTFPDKGINEPKVKDHVYEPEPCLESDKAIGIVNYFRKKVLGLIGKLKIDCFDLILYLRKTG